MPLEMRNTDDDQMIEVCLEEDGIRSCTFVSSTHLCYEKEGMLRAANAKKAAAAYKELLD